jgi:hypothetical protein
VLTGAGVVVVTTGVTVLVTEPPPPPPPPLNTVPLFEEVEGAITVPVSELLTVPLMPVLSVPVTSSAKLGVPCTKVISSANALADLKKFFVVIVVSDIID